MENHPNIQELADKIYSAGVQEVDSALSPEEKVERLIELADENDSLLFDSGELSQQDYDDLYDTLYTIVSDK